MANLLSFSKDSSSDKLLYTILVSIDNLSCLFLNILSLLLSLVCHVHLNFILIRRRNVKNGMEFLTTRLLIEFNYAAKREKRNQ